MTTIIKDGTGTGNSVKVDVNNRLHTKSVTEETFKTALVEGDAFTVLSFPVTLTSSNESGILYLKNTGEETLFVEKSIVFIGNTTGGAGNFLINTYVNPSVTSTLVSAASPAIETNLNFASTETLDADTYQGVEGSTILGAFPLTSIVNEPKVQEYVVGIVLPNSQSIAIGIVPPAGNTSCDVVFQTFVYKIKA